MNKFVIPFKNETVSTVDIFCRILDNFGDIGVCWRLASLLTHTGRYSVRLWISHPDILEKLLGKKLGHGNCLHHVKIFFWGPDCDFSAVAPADIVIEAFACELPTAYRQRLLSNSKSKQIWINLEYLATEVWADACHGLVSPQPGGQNKFFYIPGFSGCCGGLLRMTDCSRYQRIGSRCLYDRKKFLRTVMLPDVLSEDRLWISLFYYDEITALALLNFWIESGFRAVVVLPGTAQNIRLWQAVSGVDADDILRQGALKMYILRNVVLLGMPFLTQSQYDRLLGCCDMNFVRGEDSFVQAQWYGVPFVWQSYKQAEKGHLDKLYGFLDQFCEGMEDITAGALRCFWLAWNGEGSVAEAWPDYQAHLPQIRDHCALWQKKQCARKDLVTDLTDFIEKKLQ